MRIAADGLSATSTIILKSDSSYIATIDSTEKVTNGTFDSTIGWTGFGTDWILVSNKAHHVTGNTTALEQDVSPVDTEVYRILVTMSNRTVGSLTVELGGVTCDEIQANQSHVLYVVSSGVGNLKFIPTSDFDGDIDDVSVKKVISREKTIQINNSSDTSFLDIQLGTTSNSVFLGIDAGLYGVSTDVDKMAIGLGYKALHQSANTGKLIAIGERALSKINSTGAEDIAIGYRALRELTSGSNNICIGNRTLTVLRTGNSNIAIGNFALSNVINTNNQIAIGTSALYNCLSPTGGNIAIGTYSCLNLTVGYKNIGIGDSSLIYLIDGNYNTTIGSSSGTGITNGSFNTGLGYRSLYGVTIGLYNIGIGIEACKGIISGDNNIGIGNLSLGDVGDSSIGYNIAIGSGVLRYAEGEDSVGIGYSALSASVHNSGASDIVGRDVAIGSFSLSNKTTGGHNTALGCDSNYGYTPGAPTLIAVSGIDLEIGTYYYRITFVIDGVDTELGPESSVVTTSGNQQVDLSNITAYNGPLSVESRKIWRTKVDTPNTFYFVDEILDTSTTTYSDTTPDEFLFEVYNGPSSSIMLGHGAKAFTSNQMVVGSENDSINDIFLGQGVVSTFPSTVYIHATGGSGSDVAGANLALVGGRSTGSANGGSLQFLTSPPDVSSQWENLEQERMRIMADGGIKMFNLKGGTSQANAGADADELWVDTSAGYTIKIGI